MIPYTEKALELVKKFVQGAPCKVNLENIEKTMFHPHLEAIARESGLQEITVDVVKKYWFKIHNRIVAKRFKLGQLNLQQAKNCMVRSEKKGSNMVCIHGGVEVGSITKEEADHLEQNFQEALGSLQ